MPALISVQGLASGRTYGPWAPADLRMTLLEFLRAQSIPVASSCAGDGVCLKCVFNGAELSCQYGLERFLEAFPDGVVKLSYL